MSNQFKLDKNDGVAVLAFDRPEKRNPLNEGSLAELYDHLMALRDDHEVRALVLTGSGNSFCAGADLSHMKGVTDEAERVRLFSSVPARRRQLVRRTMELLVNHRAPDDCRDQRLTRSAADGFSRSPVIFASRLRKPSSGCLKSISACQVRASPSDGCARRSAWRARRKSF